MKSVKDQEDDKKRVVKYPKWEMPWVQIICPDCGFERVMNAGMFFRAHPANYLYVIDEKRKYLPNADELQDLPGKLYGARLECCDKNVCEATQERSKGGRLKSMIWGAMSEID